MPLGQAESLQVLVQVLAVLGLMAFLSKAAVLSRFPWARPLSRLRTAGPMELNKALNSLLCPFHLPSLDSSSLQPLLCVHIISSVK